jgi:hypothetical protein
MATEYASSATDGAGSTLEVGDGASPENFTAIAEITTITPGPMTTAVIDITHLLSPNAHKEKLPGLRDTTGFGLEGNWLPENSTQNNSAVAPEGLVYLARTRGVRNFQIVLGNSGSPAIVWPFRGFVESFQPGPLTIGQKKSFKASIMPSKDIASSLP